jgi:hypothetical protein
MTKIVRLCYIQRVKFYLLPNNIEMAPRGTSGKVGPEDLLAPTETRVFGHGGCVSKKSCHHHSSGRDFSRNSNEV